MATKAEETPQIAPNLMEDQLNERVEREVEIGRDGFVLQRAGGSQDG